MCLHFVIENDIKNPNNKCDVCTISKPNLVQWDYDYDIIFNADKSKSIVFVSTPNRHFLVKAMNSCFLYWW